jgi:RNA polymerase sigma-70 factor (ECF subfamily)
MRLALSDGIVDRLRQQEESAFNELFRIAGPQVVAFIMSYGPTRDEAEDALQMICIRIWQLGPRFTPAGSIESYLFTAARNEALKILRNAGIRERHVHRYADQIRTDQQAERSWMDDSSADEKVLAAWKSLAMLTEHQRTAFELRYGQEMTIPEIARILGISPKGVERLMTRVNKLIRQYVMNTSE